MSELRIEVKDAATSDRHIVSVMPDQHGMAVNVAGLGESILLDFANGRLRVFLTNHEGDIQGDPCAVLSLP